MTGEAGTPTTKTPQAQGPKPGPLGTGPLQNRRLTFTALYVLLAALFLWSLHNLVLAPEPPEPVSYTALLEKVRDGEVVKARIEETRVLAELKEGEDGRRGRVVATRLPGIDERFLLEELERGGVDVSGFIDEVSWWEGLLVGWVLPLGGLLLLWGFLFSRLGRSQGGPLSFGRAGPKIFDRSQGDPTTFEDVAGVDEAKAELREVVDFLKSPERYRALGARMPKGVLLLGPPGTGKTLLARAVAGEAGVPFFSISGSEFVEMFVGVGAARMRSLFEQAKKRAPCIVFIDEIDAIGKSRGGVGAMATHDEREQTLNQLLVEMDGFEANSGVVLMAATNRPEVLDPALLRAGRFDRQVLVDRPDLDGREAILRVHARRLKLTADVDLRLVARRTPGMAGADLANVVNEAALCAARRGAAEVSQQDFDEGLDRVQLGLKKSGKALSDDERRRVAVHEAGHALVALSLAHADPVHRVSVVPRSIGALGVTLQLPTEDHKLLTSSQLKDRLAVLLGGREAERLLTGDISTGASDDLERATQIAREMVTRYGMSEALGPMSSARRSTRFLELALERGPVSEETQRQIDEEVHRVLEAERARAGSILRERRAVLERVAEELIARETLERAQLEEIVRQAEAPVRVAS